MPAVDQRNWDGLLTTLDLLIDAVGRLPLSDPGGLDMCRDRILSAVGVLLVRQDHLAGIAPHFLGDF